MASFKHCASPLPSLTFPRSGSGPLKTMPLVPANKPAALSVQQAAPTVVPKAPAVRQPMPSPMISSPLKPNATPTSPAPRPQAPIPKTNGSTLSPCNARPMAKMSSMSEVPAVPKDSAPRPMRPTQQAVPDPAPAAPAISDGPDSFPIDEEALLQAEAEAAHKTAAPSQTTQSSPATPPTLVPPPTPIMTSVAAPAPVSPTPAVNAAQDEALRACQQEISALKYKLQVREQENEKTKQELRARHAMYSDAEKKVAHLSTQLAFKNQELLDKDIVRAPPPAPAAAPIPAPATPPAAVPAAAAAVPTQPMHTPEKMIMDGAAHPEEGSESQQEATDLEEAVEEPYAPAAQRFKVSKATQRSPQKRKAKTAQPTLAITPSSAEKKRRAMEEPTGTPTNASTDVDVLKKKLRACTSRLHSVKRALNGEFDTLDGNPSTPTAMLGVEPTTAPPTTAGNTAAYAKEIAALKEQLALREELLRQQEEAHKTEQQERDSAIAALKRMEEVIIKAEHAMKLLEMERNKLVAVIQELRAESHKIAEERLEAVRALGNAEKEIETLKTANRDLTAESQGAREKLASAAQELARLKVQNEELGNECALAKAARDLEARRASKAEKECEETRTRLLSLEQRVAEGVRQIQDDALRLVQLRRQHAQELADQRAMFDEHLKKLAPLPSEDTKRDLKSSGGERPVDASSSAPM